MAARLVVAVAALALVAAPAAAAQPTLRRGSHGALVRDWQHVLNSWLAASSRPARLREDGVFGRGTERTTRRFQRDTHVRATGVVGLRSWVGWIGAFVTCCGAGYRTLRGGNAQPDPYVGWWQYALDRWLVRHGLRSLVVDGLYGPRTAEATALFESRVGLRPTGIAAPAAWRRLGKSGSGLALP